MNAASRLAPITAIVTAFAFASPAHAQPAQPGPKAAPTYSRTEDVVYGRRDGLALTMDVFTPKKPNGAGVIIFVSAKYRSGRDLLARFHPFATTTFLDRGYVVFAVMHSSQPRYTIREIVDDAHRSVRFIKHHAKQYGIDPTRIGVGGGSSGGQLALMMGCAGAPGDPNAADPVERESSRAAAVACFFPPTDFLALQGSCNRDFAALFDFHEMDPETGMMERVTAELRREIGRALSPLTHAAKGAAPTLIIHGTEDKLVPIAQSEAMISKLNRCGVECKLVTRPGEGHHGPWIIKDFPTVADWFDTHLLGKK